MRALTPRQQEILSLIKRHIADTGFPPTRMEIARELGFRSPNAAEEHLKALARKGVIELTSGASRGIRLKMMPGTGSDSENTSAVRITLRVPLVGRVAAGNPILAQEHIEASYAIDPELFTQAPDYLLRVRGMSMRDAGILDGDLLAVKRTQEVRNGQIVIARIGDEVTVKRWRRNGHQVHLMPENPEFEPILIDTRHDEFAIEGLGVGLLRAGKTL